MQYFTFGGFTPTVSVALAASPAGVQPPGTVLTYTHTFTNGGTAAAINLAIADPIPNSTDFKSARQPRVWAQAGSVQAWFTRRIQAARGPIRPSAAEAALQAATIASSPNQICF